MPIEDDDDRRLFIQEDDFAVPVSWNRAGQVFTFPALFDSEYSLLSSPLIDAGIEGATPQIHCCGADIPAGADHDDVVTVKGKTYAAVEFKPDGTGMTIVRLQER